MIILVEILFALLIAGIGALLLKNQHGFLGIPAASIQKTALYFGIWLLVLALLMLVCILIWGSAPWPVTGILILAMGSTMLLGIIVSQKMFR
ncbi:hypothetical protein G7084_03175 [Weissella coleopterorum]|uniref:Integral membrane protein n=2 Tax=Weissella coleopterorum TaxID=2714949 RepID=A0A6G8B1Y5_9LACO|nr:hypothetical protein G7084_03175 [Weissella coleopterorum]